MDQTNKNLQRIRALDWNRDPNPNHWRTINGSHVHLDKNGNYDGGAGNKFNGRHHYGPNWKQKASLMESLTNALRKGVAGKQKNVAPQGTSASGKIKTEEETINEVKEARRKMIAASQSYKELNRGFFAKYRYEHPKPGDPKYKVYRDDYNSLNNAFKTYTDAQESLKAAKVNAAERGVMITDTLDGKCSETHISEIKKRFKAAPVEIRTLWNLLGDKIQQKTDYQPPDRANCAHDGTEARLNMEYVSKGDQINTPYQTFFHENGHGIDGRMGKPKGPYNFCYHYSADYNGGEFIKAIHKDVDNLVNGTVKEIKARIASKDLKWMQDNGIIPKNECKNVFTEANPEELDETMVKAFGKEQARKLFGKWSIEWIPVTEFPKDFKFRKAMAYNLIMRQMRSRTDRTSIADLCDIMEGATKGKIKCVAGHGVSYWKQRTVDGVEDGLATEAFAEFTSNLITNQEGRKTLEKYLPTASSVYKKMIVDMAKEAKNYG